jgi:prophage antirepressor-like protein
LTHNQIENVLLISESGIYALLVYHYCPEYRALREWLTHQVIPTLRDSQHPSTSERPHLSLLSWPDMTLSLLHWNNQPWIRLQDVPHMVTEREQVNRTVVNSWWRKALQLI